MMGQLRNALRAFAFEYDDPHTVVSRLDKLVEGMMDSAFATLVYLVVDPHAATRRGTSSPGHPPPLIRCAGRHDVVPRARSLAPDRRRRVARFEAGEVQLEQGSTILLYTDGLVERRGSPLDEGLRQLAEAASASEDDPEELVESVLGALIGDNERPDDIAVLAIRFAARRARRPQARAPVDAERPRRDARGAPRLARSGASVDAGVAAEAVLAVWEACANAVEHAQEPVAVVVQASGDARRRRPDADRGARQRPVEAGHGTAERGLGLGLMRSFMDTVEVSPSSDGTAVVMERVVRIAGRGLAARRSGYHGHASALQRVGGPPPPRRVAPCRGRRCHGQAAGGGRPPHRTDPARRAQRGDREQAAKR